MIYTHTHRENLQSWTASFSRDVLRDCGRTSNGRRSEALPPPVANSPRRCLSLGDPMPAAIAIAERARPIAEGRVPAQYLGQARLFRGRVAAAEAVVEQVTPKLWTLVRQHARKHRNPPGVVAGLWQRQMPEFGRLAQTVDTRRTALRIVEDRLLVTQFRYTSWGDAEMEPSVGVSRLTGPSTTSK